mmetsp:Transcript_70162/g.186958  ORF Transcript_70162/g.186958 Transcript_70162/m.186958 type:complete len:87 (-) Transcript_70162:676-936(-)|eukprot:CAMPEP_0113673310 /NCGR_PEP_ID=MMETSP0038_2-20120614/6784_1 /TAXON_ID=2898 /ORGANISM="Cryptomonas paramecium" /LENGTH=86 /DNA_ID=CAMNT_0000589749 /DNA_START=217 /DNA_END=477 /DNA_ORIENTATION=- /assembly_acc=CAM_ASM_000170
MVLDNISVQLGASSCLAAAFAIHERGGTQGTFLYLLASFTTETTWDVSELQLVANALLDIVLDECPEQRFNLADRSEDVNRLLCGQ